MALLQRKLTAIRFIKDGQKHRLVYLLEIEATAWCYHLRMTLHFAFAFDSGYQAFSKAELEIICASS